MTGDSPSIWVLAQNAQPNAGPATDLLGGGNASAPPPTTSSQPSPGSPAGGQSSPTPGGIPSFMWMMLILFAALIGMQLLGGRKEKRKRVEMLSALKRHDKVLTIGGLLGTVAEVRDDEVVIKVDDNSNVKVRVTRSAIQQVLKPAEASDKPSDAKSDSGGGGAPDIQVKSRQDKAAV